MTLVVFGRPEYAERFADELAHHLKTRPANPCSGWAIDTYNDTSINFPSGAWVRWTSFQVMGQFHRQPFRVLWTTEHDQCHLLSGIYHAQ